jgi:hypothetical protein
MVAAVAAKAATGVPPHARLRRALNVALGASPDAHRALGDGPGPGGMDGRRRPQRGTPSGPDTNRLILSGFGPHRAGTRRPSTDPESVQTYLALRHALRS